MVGVVEAVNQALGENGSYEWSFKNKYVLILEFGSIWGFKKNLVCICIPKECFSQLAASPLSSSSTISLSVECGTLCTLCTLNISS